ncbi:MAG TPA: sigma-70 family RNA polymerase sigma factor, partial [Pirellulaceae bacterium]|nr:sigma-70 family RNA polymerase sigma factor [Pirellulaceae bacterium]
MSSNSHSETSDWINTVVQQYERPLVRYAAQITGDLERGRDVAQDTFLRLCKQDREQLDGHLVEWLYTVCRNRALDVRRKESRMRSMTAEQTSVQESRDTDQAEVAERQDTTTRVL